MFLVAHIKELEVEPATNFPLEIALKQLKINCIRKTIAYLIYRATLNLLVIIGLI